MTKKILIIEDEKNLARFVSLELQHEGYEVTVEVNGREGLETALEKDFDLILLDLMLPEMDGFEVTRRLQTEKTTYIMMMTARDSIMDVVAGLDRGADDYIVKPFAIEELLARIRAIFRRQDIESEKKTPSQGIYRDLVLNPQNRSVNRGGNLHCFRHLLLPVPELLLHWLLSWLLSLHIRLLFSFEKPPAYLLRFYVIVVTFLLQTESYHMYYAKDIGDDWQDFQFLSFHRNLLIHF